MRIILASKSPARKQLLKTIFNDFEVIDSGFDESLVKAKSPKTLVKTLAAKKCVAVFNATNGARCVIGADTVMQINNKIIGKPKDEEDAKRILNLISGKTHKFITGVCIKYADENEIETKIVFSTTTSVTFRNLDENAINEFIKTNEYIGKAGAYAIQGTAGKFVLKLSGSFSNVIGLPTAQLCEILKQEKII